MEKNIFVGTNYHPHDWPKERWKTDIDLMRRAGFVVVRIGHLCWDSIEPKENQWDFGWLDEFMQLCKENGMSVIMDIPTRPAPVWLHKKYPDIDITNWDGIHLEANRRYMEDVGSENFQCYALRLAKQMAEHFGEHPALLGFGLCNELGDGYHSCSDLALIRFRKYLKGKYGNIETLNRAWNAQRWSRKLCDFSDIVFPRNKDIKGAPERYLDMKRFFSDEIILYLEKLSACVKKYAPNVPLTTNHWAEHPEVGFDLHSLSSRTLDYPGMGFYPGINPEFTDGFIAACMLIDYRIGEQNVPMWCLEFQTGTIGGYSAPKGVMRMYAYLALLYRSQMICMWTFRSMLGGEEQYLYGLLDHDGIPGIKYYEASCIAQELQKISKYDLPRRTKPDIAVAYSFESRVVSDFSPDYYKTSYNNHLLGVYRALFYKNLDCNFIDLRSVMNFYKLLIIPGHCLMESACAESVKQQLKQGATVIMTAYSAKVDEHNSVFDTSQPGLMDEMFGIRIAGFGRRKMHVSGVNEGGIEKRQMDITQNDVDIKIEDKILGIKPEYFEYIELKGAKSVAEYVNGQAIDGITAISENSYGRGKAVYVGVPASEMLFKFLLERYGTNLIKLDYVPEGVVYRSLESGLKLYVNTTESDQTVLLKSSVKSVLSDKVYKNELCLGKYDVEAVIPTLCNSKN